IDEAWQKEPEKYKRIRATIIMATWNRDYCIENAIKSVQNQSHSNFELLIIDDGSEDRTEEIVREVVSRDQRIKYFKQNHLGVSAARNIGLKHASGKYVFFLDSDNTWKADFLRTLIVYMEV